VETRARDIKRRTGVLPQEYNLDEEVSVFDNLVIYARYFDIPARQSTPRANELIEFMALTDKRDWRIPRLSGVMKRRLMIARALVHEPKLLILDEPTAGVDIEIRRSMWTFLRMINEQGTTIILTTHYL
jgi:ABC-type multidrug transport system ATPase subunit